MSQARGYERCGRFIYGFQRLADPDALRNLPASDELAPELAARGAALAQRFDAVMADFRCDSEEDLPESVTDETLHAILGDLREFVADSGWTHR